MEVSNLARTAEMRLLNAVCMPADDTKGKARLTLGQWGGLPGRFLPIAVIDRVEVKKRTTPVYR